MLISYDGIFNEEEVPVRQMEEIKMGDMIRFSGSYYVKLDNKTKSILSSLYKEGVVIDLNEKMISILSEGEICYIDKSQVDAVSLRVIGRSD